MAQVDGRPSDDVIAIQPARLRNYQRAPDYRSARVEEALGDVYKCHYPNKLTKSGRGAMRSPLHARLEEKKAAFRAVSGWATAGRLKTRCQKMSGVAQAFRPKVGIQRQ